MLNGGECSASHPSHFTPKKRNPRILSFPSNGRLGGPQSQSEYFAETRNLLRMLGMEL
jgi:hypothetical protein